MYKALQNLSRGMLGAGAVTVPLTLATAALLRKNPQASRKLLNIAAGVTAAGAVPAIAEETAATLDAMEHVPERLQRTSMALSNIGGYVAASAAAPLAFLLAKKLL